MPEYSSISSKATGIELFGDDFYKVNKNDLKNHIMLFVEIGVCDIYENDGVCRKSPTSGTNSELKNGNIIKLNKFCHRAKILIVTTKKFK